MDNVITVAIAIIALCVIWFVWEAYTSPIMPDDYGLTDEELKEWRELEKEKEDGL